METKYVKVPFDVELAKKITNGEVDGKIVTRDGRNARIVCWDMKSDDCIVAIIQDEFRERVYTLPNDGCRVRDVMCGSDLMLEIPEYMTFKDGDVVMCGWSGKQANCKWISLIKDVAVSSHGILTHNYATLIVESNNGADGELKYNDYSNTAAWIEKATESEKQKLIEALKASKEPKAKECLKMLGIEVKQEFEFKPFDKVLVRDDSDDVWQANIFSRIEKDVEYPYRCINGGYHE